jgi:single-strand DNA-binding protein
MRHDIITLTGLVATEPKHLTTTEGLPITSFRLASGQGWYDREAKNWVDKGKNWYTVSAFRRLALGTAASLSKGDRVIVTGRVRFREWSSSGKEGTSIEIDADAVGHDLNWGTARYTRTMGGSDGAQTPDPSVAPSAPDDDLTPVEFPSDPEFAAAASTGEADPAAPF